MDQAAHGDEILTVESIYRDHFDFIYRVAGRLAYRHVDREDAVQEVFMVVARRLDSFDHTSLVTTWLYAITLNVVRAMGRRAHREAARWADEGAAHDIAAVPVDLVEMQQAQRIAYEILDTMAPKKREVFILAEFEELTSGEIAAILVEAETHRSEHMADDTERGCTRRRFVAVGGSALAVLAMPGCGLPGARVALGAIDGTGEPAAGNGDGKSDGGDGGGGSAGDLATSPPGDAAASRDLTSAGAACPAGAVGAGAASALAVGQAMRFSSGNSYNVYLCRDAGGLFSVDARCTHTGCTVQQQASSWSCPCHGATFAFDGQQPTSPARGPLPNYAVCVDAAGNVTIDLKTTVGPGARA